MKKLAHWLGKPEWLNRLTLYLLLLLPLIIIRLSYCGFLHTDIDSARYMLSALIQSEAAIVAIVITLSLVAVQLTSSSYSVRVIDIFQKTPDFWILIVIYISSLIYGLGVLKLLEEANPKINRLSNLENHIANLYYIGAFAFVALIPYVWNTISLLKPSTIIKLMAQRITKESILSDAMKKTEKTKSVQPIIDIVHGSLMKYDFETLRDGLWAISERVGYIFENETFAEDEERKISKHVFPRLTKVSDISIRRADEDSALEVITNIYNIGKVAVGKNLKDATGYTASSLKAAGVAAAKKGLGDATEQAVIFLGFIVRTATEKMHENIVDGLVIYFQPIGQAAAENRLEDATRLVLSTLEDIRVEAVQKNYNVLKLSVESFIAEVRRKALEQGFRDIAEKAEESIDKIRTFKQ